MTAINKDKTALIMLNWNGSVDTIEAIKSLTRCKCNYDIYLIDNGSKSDEYLKLKNGLDKLTKYREIELNSLDYYNGLSLIKSDTNLGFAGANNYIAERIAPYYQTVTLLNNDVEAESGFLGSMYDTMAENDLTAVTCDIRYFYDKSELWNDGGKFTWYGDRKYTCQKKIDKLIAKGRRFITAEFITGCCLMVKSDYIIKNRLFSDKFFHGEEDFNFCKRLKKSGLRVGVDLTARIYHKVGKSLNFDKSDIKFLNKMILHYTNRVVDMKDFYGKVKWSLWKSLYCALIFIKNTISLKSFKKAHYIAKCVSLNSRFNDVKYDKFIQIMNKGVANE